MIRESYYEHPDYVPLVRRAYEPGTNVATRWQALIVETGGVFGTPRRRARRDPLAAREHESTSRPRASGRDGNWPFDNDMEIVREPRAGFVYP
jgi:hypothetical protein